MGQRFRGGRGGRGGENDDFTDSRLENLIKGCLLIAHSDDFSSLIKWHLLSGSMRSEADARNFRRRWTEFGGKLSQRTTLFLFMCRRGWELERHRRRREKPLGMKEESFVYPVAGPSPSIPPPWASPIPTVRKRWLLLRSAPCTERVCSDPDATGPGLAARSRRFYFKFDLMPSLDSHLLSII